MKIFVYDNKISIGSKSFPRHRLEDVVDKENLRIVYHGNIIIVKGYTKISKELYSVQGRTGVFFIVRADAPSFIQEEGC